MGLIKWTQEDLNSLITAINARAKITDVVKLISDQTINGIKIFTQNIIASKNIGIGGATPSNWASTLWALEGANGNAFIVNNGNISIVSTNAYYDSAWKYKVNGAASQLLINQGTLTYRYAVSGTADTAITWVTGFSIDNSGISSLSVSNTPSGNISSTTVQGAINELDSEKVSTSGNETIAGIKTFSSSPIVPTPTNATDVANKTYVDSVTGVRLGYNIQTVQYASVDSNGLPNFVTIGSGLSVNIAATSVPIRIHAAGGNPANDRIGILSADTTQTGLTANTTNYLYFDIGSDGTVTKGFTTLAPNYQIGGTYSITNLQNTYNIVERTMKVGNGSTVTQVYRVFYGEVVTGASSVTSVVNYALNGVYQSALQPVGAVTLNHNLGLLPLNHTCTFVNQAADSSYVAGDEVTADNILQSSTGKNLTVWKTNKNLANSALNSSAYIFQKTGALAAIANANWKIKHYASRGW